MKAVPPWVSFRMIDGPEEAQVFLFVPEIQYPAFAPLSLDFTDIFIHFMLIDREFHPMDFRKERIVRVYTAVIEKCPDTGFFVEYIPGLRGAHSQGETLDELNRNLKEVVELILEDGEYQ